MNARITISDKKKLKCILIVFLVYINIPIYTQVSLLGSWVTGTTHAAQPGANRAMVVLLFAENGNNIDVITSGVSYAGQGMTKIKETSITNGSFYSYVGAYVLGEAAIAAATSNNIEVAWVNKADNTAYVPGGSLIVSAFFNSVNQAELYGANSVNAVTGTPRIDLAELQNENGDMLIVGAVAAVNGFFTFEQSGFAKFLEVNIPEIGGIGAASMPADGTSVTPSAVNATSSQGRLAMIGFVLKKSVASSTNKVFANNLFRVYPNPAANKLVVMLQNENVTKDVKIFNSTGKEIYSARTNADNLTVDLSLLNYKGVALVRVVSNGTAQTQKFAVE